MLAQFHSGLVPLSVETGRYLDIQPQYRLCIFSDFDSIEDERHFLYHCPFYVNERTTFFQKVIEEYHNFDNILTNDKVCTLMKPDIVKQTATYLYYTYVKRKYTLYK